MLYQHIQAIQANTGYHDTSIYRQRTDLFGPVRSCCSAAGWMQGAQFDSSVDAPERMRNRQPSLRFNSKETRTEIMSSYTRSSVLGFQSLQYCCSS